MLQKALIREFLEKSSIAVVGVSRKADIPANSIFRKFQQAGYTVYPINPNADTVEGVKCYPNLASLPEMPEAVMLAGPPAATETAVQDCIRHNVPIVWMHKGIGRGSYSEKADHEAEANGVRVIRNGCPLMFVDKVDGFHKALRWFK